MGNICRNCGNEELFKAWQAVTRYETETVWVDSENDVQDWGDSNCGDSEVTEGPNDLECDRCGSTDVIWEEDEAEIEQIKANAPHIPLGQQRQSVVTNWRGRLGGG